MRQTIIFGGLAFVLLVPTALIIQKEALRAAGQKVLLELDPQDPRSLMQGDYMMLNYAISERLGSDWRGPREGHLVVRLDAQGVGRFVRYQMPGNPLVPGELLLHYRLRNGRVRLGAETFFFQEGTAHLYEGARYGELRVDPEGTSVLVGLRGSEREVLGAANSASTPASHDAPREETEEM